MKGIYANRPVWFQLMVLLLLVLGGALLASLLSLGILFLVYGQALYDAGYSPGVFRWLQFLSSVTTFLLPALALAWLCSRNPARFLSIKGIPGFKALALVFAGMIVLSPVINLSEFWNRQMELPSFMEPVEKWMQAHENATEEIISRMLEQSGIISFLSNLLVIAFAAGITEEFLFRGALQRIIGKGVINHHFAIWITATLFSAFHLQFYGFLPRMILGAYFGYLLYWSKNIWIPVLAHITNNTVAVIIMACSGLKNNEILTGELSGDMVLPYSIVAVIAVLLLIPLIKRLKRELTNKREHPHGHPLSQHK
jgi:membrane protease YdiL (CAAX protease family)